LGQGCGETLPSLRRIPTSYRLETNGERLYRLCLALVERNLADEQLWQRTGEVAVVFARSALQKLIEEFAGAVLQDKIDYCFEVRDDHGTGYWRGGALGEGKLMAAFELQACGYLKIGAALEQQERFLGAAFYYLLRGSVYRWIRIYDHTDAECYNEQLHEWMEQDESESRDAYEFPAVDEAIPEPVRTAKEWTYPSARRLLRRHLQGPHSVWIQKLLTLHRLSRLKGQVTRDNSRGGALSGTVWRPAPTVTGLRSTSPPTFSTTPEGARNLALSAAPTPLSSPQTPKRTNSQSNGKTASTSPGSRKPEHNRTGNMGYGMADLVDR